MVTLQINNRVVDMYTNETFTLTWKNPVLTKSDYIQTYSNDFTIPLTQNNRSIFNITTYWNVVSTVSGEQSNNILNGLLMLNTNIIPVYVYVVSYNDTSITVCCTSRFAYDFNNKLNMKNRLFELVEDSDNTIKIWDNRLLERLNSNQNDRESFLVYKNNVNNTNALNRLHPSSSLSECIVKSLNKIGLGVDLGGLNDKLDNCCMISTRKVVSPYNKKQILHLYCNQSDEYITDRLFSEEVNARYMRIIGSQHIANDTPGCEYFSQTSSDGVEESGTTSITFNRPCRLRIITTYVSAYRTSTSSNIFGQIFIGLNEHILNNPFTMGSSRYYFKKNALYAQTISINEGDVLWFGWVNGNGLKHIEMVMELEITGYEIDASTDFGTELIYSANLPYLRHYTGIGENYKKVEFDGKTVVNSLKLPYYSYSYFGINANLPDVTLHDLLNSLCLKYGYTYNLERDEEGNNRLKFIGNSNEFNNYKVYRLNTTTVYDQLFGEPSEITDNDGNVVKSFNTKVVGKINESKSINTTVIKTQKRSYISINVVIDVPQYSWTRKNGVEYLDPSGVWYGVKKRYSDYNFIFSIVPEDNQDDFYTNTGIEGIDIVKKVNITLPKIISPANFIAINGVKVLIHDMEINLTENKTVINGYVSK